VQSDLESEGYEVQPYVLPAVSVNAPHRRDRVWFVAFDTNSTTSGEEKDLGGKNGERISGASKKGAFQETYDKCFGFGEVPTEERIVSDTESSSEGECKCGQGKGKSGRCHCKTTSNTNSGRFTRKEHREKKSGQYSQESLPKWFQDFPTQSPVCSGDDGLPNKLDGITFPKWRNESIKAYGNAIVPQVAYQIFKAIEEYEKRMLNN
jgi:DNA (cytosine-5)-methyltransferase 1